MPVVVVERALPISSEFDDIQAKEDAIAWCLEEHAVSGLVSYFSRDHKTMVCVYDAPDAEAVRTTQRTGKLPFELVWPAITPATALPMAADRREVVVVQRPLPAPTQASAIAALVAQSSDCAADYGVEHLCTLLSLDGLNSVCLFAAPDAEAVRTVSDRFKQPYRSVFAASVHS